MPGRPGTGRPGRRRPAFPGRRPRRPTPRPCRRTRARAPAGRAAVRCRGAMFGRRSRRSPPHRAGRGGPRRAARVRGPRRSGGRPGRGARRPSSGGDRGGGRRWHRRSRGLGQVAEAAIGVVVGGPVGRVRLDRGGPPRTSRASDDVRPTASAASRAAPTAAPSRVAATSWARPVTSDTICMASSLAVPPPAARSRSVASPASAAVSRSWRSPNAMPSSTALTRSPRPWASVSPAMTPRAAGSYTGVDSPANDGTTRTPRAPGGDAVGLALQQRVRGGRIEVGDEEVGGPAHERAGRGEARHRRTAVPGSGPRSATAPVGRWRGRAKVVRVVVLPCVMAVMPGRVAPIASASIGPSLVPTRTGRPSGNPVARAAAAVTVRRPRPASEDRGAYRPARGVRHPRRGAYPRPAGGHR